MMVDKSLLKKRDSDLGINTEKVKQERIGIETPNIAPGADQWQNGVIYQLAIEKRKPLY